MTYLWGVTFLWAFSFSLIGVYLAHIDSYFAVLTRIVLALLVLLPFWRPKKVSFKIAWRLMFLGAMQIGFMYLFFYQSFKLLKVYEVVLFTIFTPIYITLIDDLLAKRFSPLYLLTASLAVLGAWIIRYQGINEDFILGFLLVQAANLSFAIGQTGYKHLANNFKITKHSEIFAYFYIGALPVALIAFLLFGNLEKLPTNNSEWTVLIYLGVIASGLGYFLWNKGASLVNAGDLAIMNNALIPLGLLVNLLIWQQSLDWLKLIIGGSIILLSLGVNSFYRNKNKSKSKSKSINSTNF